MVVSAHQPSYFPWLGWLHKIASSDLFILMDEVQLSDKSYQHRNIFLTNTGKVKYLTIPFEKKGYLEKNICELGVNQQVRWQKNHFNFIKENYRKHPFFEEIIKEIEPFFYKDYSTLIDILSDEISLVMNLFDVKTKIVYQSSLDYDRETVKNDLVLELVKSVDANTYLSGVGAKSYLDIESFNRNNIAVVFQEFKHPEYMQQYSNEFLQGMNCLDVLFNLGIDKSRDLLKKTLQ